MRRTTGIAMGRAPKHMAPEVLKPVTHTLYICTTCKRAGDGALLGAALIEDLAQSGAPQGFEVVGTACMSNCMRPLSVALAAPGKATYLLAEVDPVTDREALIELAELYAGKEDGQTKLLERPKSIRRKIVARVPPAR